MYGQIGSDNSESEVIPFARAKRTSTSDGADQLDKAGQTILQTERPALQKKTADTLWRWRRGSRINCARPKIELRSWKRRSLLVRKELSGLSSGFIGSTRRLKIDFFSRAIAAAL
jgi:hypothetical protein